MSAESRVHLEKQSYRTVTNGTVKKKSTAYSEKILRCLMVEKPLKAYFLGTSAAIPIFSYPFPFNTCTRLIF